VLGILAGLPRAVEVVHLRTADEVRSYARSLSQQSSQRGS
jgi:hypothetical protein